MKKCNSCLGEFPFDMFHVKRASVDGYNNVCKPCKKLKNELFYANNRESKLVYQKEYREKNKEVVDAYKKAYNKTYAPKYYEKNKEKKIAYSCQYHRERKKTDENFRLASLLRSRFHHALKNGFKMKSVIELVGCTIDEFRLYVESLFFPEMTWENHGDIWEIDHILPCASFDLTLLEEQKKCFHFSNHQPLFKTTAIAQSFGYNDIIGNRNKLHKLI
jgi:hypothetical protein